MKKIVAFCLAALLLSATYIRAETWLTYDYPEAVRTSINGIEGGSIVGTYVDNQNNYHGFLYDGTNWTTFDKPSAHWTMIYGINSGNIVGEYWDSQGDSHGFLYDGTGWSTLDKAGAVSTWVYGVEGGKVFGNYRDALGDHGFIYNDGKWQTLDYPNETDTQIRGIEGEMIVGIYFTTEQTHRGFMYDGTTWTTISSDDIEIVGIDGSDLVGEFSGSGAGFLYDGTNWSILQIPDALTTNVYGISGQNIYGKYEDALGTHGYIYVIPEPATLSLLALGGLLAIRKKQSI